MAAAAAAPCCNTVSVENFGVLQHGAGFLRRRIAGCAEWLYRRCSALNALPRRMYLAVYTSRGNAAHAWRRAGGRIKWTRIAGAAVLGDVAARRA